MDALVDRQCTGQSVKPALAASSRRFERKAPGAVSESRLRAGEWSPREADSSSRRERGYARRRLRLKEIERGADGAGDY
jgi:hypothetical protein